MALLAIQCTVAAVFAVALTVVLRRALGLPSRQDPILLAGSVVSAGFFVGGIVGLALAERGAIAALCLGAIGAIAAARRWQRQYLNHTPTPND